VVSSPEHTEPGIKAFELQPWGAVIKSCKPLQVFVAYYLHCNMWKPKIYLGTSVFDMILSANDELKRSSLLLLEKCKDQLEYEGYVSAYTIYELSYRSSAKQMAFLGELLNKYDIYYIQYLHPGEIDYLAVNYIQKDFLSGWPAIEYYHFSTCAYLNLEYYVCWNKDQIINFPVFRSILHTHIPRGYRSNINLCTPEFLTGVPCWENSAKLIDQTVASKMQVTRNVQEKPPVERSSYVQAKSDSLISGDIHKKVLPDNQHYPARMPVLDLKDVPLKFNVRSFNDQIRRKEIPLLDLGYEFTGFDMDYHLFKLEVEQGSGLLKNKQMELIYHLPVNYTEDEYQRISQERNKKFIDWLLPQVRAAIDNSTTSYAEIEKDHISGYSYRELDYKLSSSFFSENKIATIKRKAIDLADLISNNTWQNYQGFLFPGPWCIYQEGFSYGEQTHLIIEKEGGHIWLILINAVIP